MRILFRNFTRLLSIGAFGSDCALEDMSEFKWRKLLRAANAYGVSDYVCNGIVNAKDPIPQSIIDLAGNDVKSYDGQDEKSPNFSNFAANIKVKKFSNIYLNNRYNKIIFNEVHSIDTSINSLVLLNMLVDNINTYLNAEPDIRQLAEFGAYLRKNGSKIDFVKTDSWIKSLNINEMSNIIGWHLIILFGFENEEIPFVNKKGKRIVKKAQKILDKTICMSAANIMHNEENAGTGSINPITRSNVHPLKYFRSFPLETSSRFIANAIRSLSNIDE